MMYSFLFLEIDTRTTECCGGRKSNRYRAWQPISSFMAAAVCRMRSGNSYLSNWARKPLRSTHGSFSLTISSFLTRESIQRLLGSIWRSILLTPLFLCIHIRFLGTVIED